MRRPASLPIVVAVTHADPGSRGDLEEIKEDENLRRIPVVVLTISKDEEDILKTYDLHANCYVTKPLDLDRFIEVVKSIENFWLAIVKLPPNGMKR